MPQLLWQVRGIVAPLELLDEAHNTYGDLFRLPYDYPAVCVCSPTGLQAVFTAPPAILESHQRGSVFDLVMGEQALVFLEGKAHQRHRQLLMPPFHAEQLQRWGTEIAQQTRQSLAQLPPQSTFNVREVMKQIALTVILQVVVGSSSSYLRHRLHSLLFAFFEGAESPLSTAALLFPFLRIDWGKWSPWGYFLAQKRQINQILLQEIRQRQEFALSSGQSDLLGLLLQVGDEAGQGLSLTEICDELLMLVFAGYETTTSAIVWTLYWVLLLPAVKTRLEAELQRLADPHDALAIAQLPYLSAVCQEVLRIYPVAIGAFARRVRQPFELDGYRLPVGTVISPSIYLAHRRQSVYPNPRQFDPERFVGRSVSAYEYLPFGGGNRRCLGASFALFEMKLILATVLQSVPLSLLSAERVEPVRYGITMVPPIGLQMRRQ